MPPQTPLESTSIKGSPLPNNLEFNDWFKPFNSFEPVNPFVYEDWTTEQSGINFYR